MMSSWNARAFKYCVTRKFSYKSVKRPDISALGRKLTAPEVTDDNKPKSSSASLSKQLKARIVSTGPITVADYMREVLTNPHAGYYMNRDVFGKKGDFITSPEISQIFGELVGIWLITEWRKLGSPSPFQLVELGPGRGTLSRDVLKVLTKFKLGAQFSMHLVEVSPFLSKTQAQRFCYKHATISDQNMPYYQVGTTATGVEAYWYKRLEDVPREFSLVLAHEFFDALPMHKLQLENGIWKEILIDVADPSAENVQFRFVLSKGQTPISKIFKTRNDEQRQCLEYSLETETLVSALAQRLENDGGINLIMDYGHFGDKTDTFRAFKQHALHDPLSEPGSADLTADVDFYHLKHVAEANGQTFCCGPIEQGEFLKRMQGDARLEQLLSNALPENQAAIKSGYDMLTDPKQMGSRFKFFAMFPGVLKEHLAKYPVAGFF